jgi:hypothetical protein
MILNASVILWLAGACGVLGLAIYRKMVAMREDDNLHIGQHETGIVAQQQVVAAKLDVVDKWGVALTIGVVAFGMVLAGVFIYQQWQASLELPK